jgi:hypothetical protein
MQAVNHQSCQGQWLKDDIEVLLQAHGQQSFSSHSFATSGLQSVALFSTCAPQNHFFGYDPDKKT